MEKINFKTISIVCLLVNVLWVQQITGASVKSKSISPNFIVIFADDMGYGDMGCNGHPTIFTPNLDKMATEGQKWTNFYVAESVCTPSRAGLLTGRLPIRSGVYGEKRRVFFQDSYGGLPEKEITIASALKNVGYKTACIGKWHLGHLSKYSPNAHGFDYYYGIPYSNDMDFVGEEKTGGLNWHETKKYNPKIEHFNVPLMRNSEIIERPADQTTITKRYTEETINFIKQNKKNPFFIYLAHAMPHVPLFRSKEFENKSLRGRYGDVIEELDWSVGQILSALKETGLDKNTLVVFTSDNGPWLYYYEEEGGSAGLLREGKGSTFEGGMREPAIFWWPGTLKPGVVADMATTMDLLPTFCKLARTTLPDDRVYDGYDIYPLLTGTGKSERDVVFYYRGSEIFAIRKGAYKAHFITQPAFNSDVKTPHDPPLLFNLNVDPSEKYNIANKHPEIIEEIKKVLKEHQATVVPVESQVDKF